MSELAVHAELLLMLLIKKKSYDSVVPINASHAWSS